MQDRYVGDIGDFAKYGLLRAIRGEKRLGVAWYLCPSASSSSTGSGDGRHVDYLRQPEKWRRLDPELFDTLKRLVDGGERSVDAIQKSGILGENIAFADNPLNIVGVAVRDRVRWRREWFEKVKENLSDCDLVFADPDNGLYPDRRFKPTRKDNAKRIPLAEAKALAQGRSAIVYHHNTRRPGGHRKEIQDWMRQLPDCAYAWYWRRWSNRTFFFINPDQEIERRFKIFADSWNCHGELIKSSIIRGRTATGVSSGKQLSGAG